MEFTMRAFRSDDIPSITRVINTADAMFGIEDGATEQELSEQLGIPGLDPERNVFVAEQNGQVVGFGLVRFFGGQTEDIFRTWFQVHPDVRGRGLEERILIRLYQRAEEFLPECKAPTLSFNAWASALEKERIAAIERLGFVETRRNWVMVRRALDDIPEPEYPDGIIVRPYRIGADDVETHRADNEAFRDHWQHADHPLEMWQYYVTRPAFKPDLSVVAQDSQTGEIAGFCMITINDEENARLGVRRGWLDVLGVRRPYRRQGLGTALILKGLHNLRDARVDHAALGCDAENITGATRIYKRVGFTVHRERIIYSKPMTQKQPLVL